MGGSQSSCIFSKPKCKHDEIECEPRYVSRRIRPSDDDRRPWIGESDVDLKASAFIAKFHESRFMDIQSCEAPAADHEMQTAVVA